MTFWKEITGEYYDLFFYVVTGWGFLFCLSWTCFFIINIIWKHSFARRAIRARCKMLEVTKRIHHDFAERFQYLVEVFEPSSLSGKVFVAEYRPQPRFGEDWDKPTFGKNHDDGYLVGKEYDCWVDQARGLCCMNPRPSNGSAIVAIAVFVSIKLLILASWFGFITVTHG